MMPQSIEELSREGKIFVNSRYYKGVKKLLTDLYPDNAHFIYELLQNAEDTHAETVRFTLADEAIEFEHDGDRLFNFGDVESILDIGTSTKCDDPTSIGKFGVGFKAVFAYTNTPEIHSGDYHFRIRDLVIPEIDGVAKPNMANRETRFIFPFDHSIKRPEKAVAEIEHGLRALGDNVLLFLNHIHKLEYLLPEGSLGSFERINHEDGHIEIRSSHPNSEDTVSHWLRFEKVVEVTDEDGESKSCRIAVAYSLDKNDSKKKNLKKNSSFWKISPLDDGQVSIFFPAEKETSNLKFHLHAPFASTVARDSVRDCEANDQLRDCLAELVVESLSDIRDKGMLTMEFLSVLPNPMDNLSSFYEPVSAAIIQAFKSEKLTPTRKGGYAPVTELYRGPKKIDDVLGVDGLSLLTNGEPRPWAANPPQQNQRDAYFLDSLEIDSWEWWDLSWALSHLDEDEQEILEAWVAQKDDAWVMRFYALLGEACDTHDECVKAENLRIIRVASEDGDKHIFPKDAYFPPEQEINFPVDILLVKPSVCKSKTKRQYARLFLEEIGVRNFDEEAVIEYTLKSYAQKPPTSQKKHMQHMKQFVKYWQERQSCINMFRGCAFLMGNDGSYHKPKDLFLDVPFEDTGLTDFFSDSSLTLTHRKIELSHKYKSIKRFNRFAVELGVMTALQICDYKATEMQEVVFPKKGRETRTTVDEDYYINGLHWHRKGSGKYFGSFRLTLGPLSLSRVVWLTMCAADPKVLTAHYLPNASWRAQEKKKSSFLVEYLRSKVWVPDCEGKFNVPAEVTVETLHPDFKYDDRNGWLTAIGFGEGARKRSEEYVSKNNHAKELGFDSADEAEKLARLAELARENGKSLDELLEQFCPTVNQPLFPEHSVANPERREERFAKQHADAPAKNYGSIHQTKAAVE